MKIKIATIDDVICGVQVVHDDKKPKHAQGITCRIMSEQGPISGGVLG